MDKLKQYVVLTVIGSLAILALGYNFLVSPKKAEANDLRTQTASQVSANAQLQTQLTVLKAQAKDLPKQQAKLAAVAARIPDNPALPALIRALTAAASSAAVELVSVTPGQPAAPAAPAAAPAVASGTAGAARPAAAAGGTAGTLASIPLALNVVGGYFQVEQFVANLENLPRSLRISGLTLAPGANPVKKSSRTSVDDGKSLTTTITGQVFMAANRPAATPVTVPGQVSAPVAPVAPVTVTVPAKK
ncbi:MAG: type 4a pilus biogenesis protein PilO [Actinobacteria bacterium]|nr:type 4a pilus biogenesis protein PilO [Actinomycetota bacterium]MCA1720050.1 type 4a pilus biogenesis protein PilO [Actinomycetota bacterium]